MFPLTFKVNLLPQTVQGDVFTGFIAVHNSYGAFSHISTGTFVHIAALIVFALWWDLFCGCDASALRLQGRRAFPSLQLFSLVKKLNPYVYIYTGARGVMARRL